MQEFFDRLRRFAAVAGHAPALVSRDNVISYAALTDLIRAKAKAAQDLPPRIGLLAATAAEAIVDDLALTFAGKELVPLPGFFSDAQLSHIARTAGLAEAVTDRESVERVGRLGLRARRLGACAMPDVAPAEDAKRIIFTSGTTGSPKGVCLSGKQLLASVAGLGEAAQASSRDRYLSVLPHAFLLEQIAGMFLPLSLGAAIYVMEPFRASPGTQIADNAARVGATATVLVPDLLAAWVDELRARGKNGPASLRFIAVGGAPVSQSLAAAAWQRGLPVHEGYGLSECCSVVSVNRPHCRRAGTVGRPLANLDVRIEGGEIVVSGPTIMNNYLGEKPTNGTWRTGDLGRFDDDDFLVVGGRQDNVIVTAAGRNVSPEWIEQVIAADRRIRRCVVVAHQGELAAVIVPEPSLISEGAAAVHELVNDAVRSLPGYARPRLHAATSEEELRRLDLLTANQRPRRAQIGIEFARRSRFRAQRTEAENMSGFEQLLRHTASARQDFIALPLIQDVLQSGASRALYLDFLGQAYHHVKCTAPLLALAAARCRAQDGLYQSALFEYIEEERGHELWILDDIDALGGDAAAVRHSAPRFPCKVMVGHAYYVIDHVSPYGLLGMVHVLEGMSVALAARAAAAIRSAIAPEGDGGFKYLTSHGALDVAHAGMFENLINQIDGRHLPAIIEAASDFYRLYGALFQDLDTRRNMQNAS